MPSTIMVITRAFIAGIVVLGVVGGEARAQLVTREIVSAKMLRRACIAVVADAGGAKDRKSAIAVYLAEYCSRPNMDERWERLGTAADTAPSLSVIQEFAAKSEESQLDSVKEWEHILLQQSGLASKGSGLPDITGVAWQSRLLFALEATIQSRVEEQLRAIAWQKVTAALCDPKGSGLLLPNTCDFLSRPDIDVASLIAGGSLKVLIRKDVQALPVNALTVLGNRAESAGPEARDRILAARAVTFLALDLSEGRPLEVSLSRLAFLPPTSALDLVATPVGARLAQVALFAASSGAGGGDFSKAWAADEIALSLLYNHRALVTNIALGLPFPMGKAGSFTVCAVVSCIGIKSVSSQVEQFATDLKKLKLVRDSLANVTEPTARRAAMVQFVQVAITTIIDHVEHANPESHLPGLRSDVDAVGNFVAALIDARYADAIVEAVQFAESQSLGVRLSPNALRFATAAGSIAQANDDASMAKAVDLLVAPPNRFLRKRDPKAGIYFMLNAYLGVVYGREQACATAKGCSKTTSVGGAYLPVTIDIGRGVRWGPVRSFSLSVQAVDLGAIASWRLGPQGADTNAVRSAPEVGFAQVFAPGAHLVFGFSGPVALGIGTSASPRLRSLVDETQNTPRNGIRRLSLWLAMDVPVFP